MILPGAQQKRLPRSSAGVTADRLAYAVHHWSGRFTQAERDAAGTLIARLNEIAEDPKK